MGGNRRSRGSSARSARSRHATADAGPQPASPGLPKAELALFAALAAFAAGIRIWSASQRVFLGTFEGMIDSAYYLRRAGEVLTGGAVPGEAFFMSPLYPYLLALCGASPGGPFWPVVLFQAALGVAGLVLLALGVRKVAGRDTGLATLGLAALAGPPALYDTSLLPDGPSLALLQIGVGSLFWVSRKAASLLLLPGVALALATGLRSNLLLVVLLIAALLYRQRLQLRRSPAASILVFLAPTAAVLVTTATLNVAAEGLPSPLSYNSGLNLYIGNNPSARGTYTVLDGIHPGDPRGRAAAEAAAGRRLDTAEIDRHWRGEALDFILDHPGRTLGLIGRRLVLFWSAYEIPQMEAYDLARVESPVLMAAPLGFAWLIPLAVFGALARAGHSERGVLGALAFGTLFTCALFFVNGRLRLPVWAALVPLAGCGLAALTDSVRLRKRPATIPAIAGLAMLALSLAATRVTGIPRDWNRAQSALRYAVIEALAGNTGAANRWIAYETRLEPSLTVTPLLRLEKGAALFAAGRPREAFPWLRDAADQMPANTRAQQGLEAVCLRLIRRNEADAGVSDALRRARQRLDRRLPAG